jgi:hypothetical protein
MQALIGVSLGPERSHAAVVRGRDVLASLSADGADPAALLPRAVAACGGEPGRVVIDISRLLLSRVLHEHTSLSPVAVIRIVPRAATDPALGRHPDDVVERLVTRRYLVPGGHDLFGHELRPLDREALREVCTSLEHDQVAVVSTGSPMQPRHEREVADALLSARPDARISAAHEFGGLGMGAREATVVLNSALSAAAADIVDRCEQAARGTPFHVARGDGGWVSASRLRTLPVLGLGAADALQLAGAATLAGIEDCRVLLDRRPHPVIGDVRNGLPAARPQPLPALGTALTVPTAELTHANPLPPTADTVPLVKADRDPDELTCVGAAVSRPAAWLDEIAFVSSTAQLAQVRQDAQARATAIATTNGATPGSAVTVESSAVAIAYGPSGTVRIRVRVVGALEVGP